MTALSAILAPAVILARQMVRSCASISQKVTPGSVAAATIDPGDLILKIGNVMATNLEHNDAQELVRQSGNILQLTIKKPDGAASPGPISPTSYGSQLTIQTGDYSTALKGFGTGIPINNSHNYNNSHSPNYATTPRNFGSQQHPVQATRIEIQRSSPAQDTRGYTNNLNEDHVESDGLNFPDYTLAYKKQDLVHDSPGGPDNIRGYVFPNENEDYSTQSLPRGVGGNSKNDESGFQGVEGPPAYEPRSSNAIQTSFTPDVSVDVKFGTGIPFQSSPNAPQESFITTVPQIYKPPSKPAEPSYNSLPRSSSPLTYSGPVSPRVFSGPSSPRIETNSVSGFSNREQSVPVTNPSSQISSYDSLSISGDQSNIHGSGSNTFSTLPRTKPTYNTNNNNSFNVYKSSPQPYSAPKPYAPSQSTPSSTFNQSAMPFTPSQPKPFQSMAPPGSTSGFSSSKPVIRKVSLDHSADENGAYIMPTNFTARPYKPPQIATTTTYAVPVYNHSTDADNGNRVIDMSGPAPKPQIFAQQPSETHLYTALPYIPPGGPVSPRSESGSDHGVNRHDPSSISEGVNSLNLASSRYQSSPLASPGASPPPPPPPPQFSSVPPPPPVPSLNEWNPTPYRRPNYPQNEEFEVQKIPDQLLGTMMQSAKSGGPKPFSYGIDLTELKKKIGPPTAPKPRQGEPNFQDQAEVPEAPKQYSGPPKKPAGHVQSDYFIKRDGSTDPAQKASKKPVGHVQSDYFLSRQTGPRSEIDESPINISMGTDPKKQSKSFKVLQWMTETEQDDSEEPSQKPRRTKDPERRHNADDDEMRFTGLHSTAEIPSKTFGILQRLSSNEGSTVAQNGKSTLDVGDADDWNRNGEETSVRYRSASIPSPSFRLLQSWAEHDPDPNIIIEKADSNKEDEDDDLPETLNNDEMVDKRYMGANIPSKVFKVLQQSLGDDISEELPPPPPPLPNDEPLEGEFPEPDESALISDF